MQKVERAEKRCFNELPIEVRKAIEEDKRKDLQQKIKTILNK